LLVSLRVVAEFVGLEDTAVFAGVDRDEFVFHRRVAGAGVAERGSESNIVVAVSAYCFFVALAADVICGVHDDEAEGAEFVGLNVEGFAW